MCEQCTNDAPGDGLPECPRTEPPMPGRCPWHPDRHVHLGKIGCFETPDGQRRESPRRYAISAVAAEQIQETLAAQKTELAALRKVAEAARNIFDCKPGRFADALHALEDELSSLSSSVAESQEKSK